ncbi:hypothetical protein MN116_000657 [Schistosoma mekongi]|uniref:Uncharacterized protein n=1 Tax=Schistosoma mekongi TaxID=38744 RepID=A0AAE1ZKZ9_SCHME|nr:hypothetical protein MN116_000657 [Schistosoma mekongi]
MLNNSNEDDIQKLDSLTKRQFNLYRHLNSNNIKSVLNDNDKNAYVNYIQCSICNCPHQLTKIDTTNNNLISSKLEENHANHHHHHHHQQQQQQGAYCNNLNSMKSICSCYITWLHQMKPSNSNHCQLQNINCKTNHFHSLHCKLTLISPICNCYNEEEEEEEGKEKEEIQKYKCKHCLCQRCIQTK